VFVSPHRIVQPFVIVMLGAGLAAAQTADRCRGPDGVDLCGSVTLVIENDLFGGGSDRHFTHGTRLSYLAGEDDAPLWARRAAAWVPTFSANDAMRMSYTLGQNIYTPDDITRRDLITADRPYAGWLYAGVGVVSHRPDRLDNLELNIGIVGPQSFADQMQKFVHRVTPLDARHPTGWNNQLKNEPGVVLFYERQWRSPEPWALVGDLGFDATPHGGFALGNVFTHAAAGLTVRLGENLRGDFGTPRARPSLPGAGIYRSDPGFGWYVFAGAEARAVARNIFLDGNTFADSHHVDRRWFVHDVQAGIELTFRSYRLAYTQIWRSKEFEGQARADRFGAISLSARF
jgi:lipid A 3-O-deacylase